MTAEEALIKLMSELLSKFPSSVSVGVVDEIDKEKRTCTVSRDGQPKLFNVRLNSVIDSYKDCVVVYPKQGSYVLCLSIENSLRECYLIATSEVEEVKLQIGSQSLIANADGFTFNEGKHGMVKIKELTDKINSLVSTFNGHIHAVAGAATKTPEILMQTLEKDSYEDTKIKH